MESVFNCIDECIMVLDEKNIIKFCNKSLLNILGYNLNDIQKKNLINIIQGINNFDSDGEVIIYNKENTPVQFTYKVNNAIWKGNSAKILVLKEKELYTKADLEKILENIPLLVWMRDLEGKYIYVNRAYCDFMKLSKDEIIGKRDRDFLCKEDSSVIEEEDRRLIKEKCNIIEQALLF